MATVSAVPRVHRAECAALPKGWIREEVPRMSNNIHGVGGRSDVYYISPIGKKIRYTHVKTASLMLIWFNLIIDRSILPLRKVK